jgi:hypothetical protein
MSENSTLPLDQSNDIEETVPTEISNEDNTDSSEMQIETDLPENSESKTVVSESILTSEIEASSNTLEVANQSNLEPENEPIVGFSKDEPVETESMPEAETISVENSEVVEIEISPEVTMSEEEKATEPVAVTEVTTVEPELVIVHEAELEELAEAEAERESEDYSGLTKEQIVTLAEQLNRDNDPLTSLRVIQKLKPLFETLFQYDKNEALEKFISEGNEKETFEFKYQSLEQRFNQAAKGIYEKRKLNQEFQLKERSKNLETKLTLLEQLRKLVDDHEHTPGYDKFKVIREEWKKIGPVGPEHAQNLNASYYSLIERFYSLSEIYHNLRDFDRKKNLELKLDIISKIEKLAEEPMISKAMKDLMSYQDDYRSLGPITKDKLDEVKDRLKKAVDVIYEKRRVFNEERKSLIAEEISLKEAIIAKIPDFETYVSNSTKEWQAKTQELLALQEEWKKIPGRFREKTNDLNKQFWSVYKKFMHNKNEFFKQLDKGKKDILLQKQALVEEVNSLKDGEDWDGIANKMKQLQQAWKEVAPAYGKEGQKVYEDFKAGIDHFFTRLREQRSGEDKIQFQNLADKESICVEIEGLASSGTGTKELVDQLKEKFRAVGFVPMKAMQRINSRFSKAMMEMIENSTLIPNGEKERLKISLLSNRSTYSSEGIKSLKNQEGYIQKRLQQLKKDVGNLEDNVAMFKMSKNAIALLEDVQKKINLSKLEIKELESQLKEIRAGEKS